MNSTTALYNNLDKPDNINPIDINATPQQIIHSTYKLWEPITRPEKYFGMFPDPNTMEQLYTHAVNLLSPYKELFGKVKSKDLDKVLSEIGINNSDNRYDSGLFISALLNTTDLKELDGVFQNYILGHKLGENKKLIVRAGSKIHFLGHYSQGELINFGEADEMSYNATSGISINFGKVDFMSTNINGGVNINLNIINRESAYQAQGGLYLNFGNFKNGKLAFMAVNGIQINYNRDINITGMGINARGGLQANFGNSTQLNPLEKYGTQVSFLFDYTGLRYPQKNGIQFNFEVPEEKIFEFGTKESMKIATPLINSLESKLKEITFIKELEPDKAVDTILKYDWKSFEAQIINLKGEIEDILK